MRCTTIRLLLCAAAQLLFAGSITCEVLAQPHPQQKWSREELIAAAREIMEASRYCALITKDSKGRTHARTMDPFPPDENMNIWFGTNARSRKVAEIRRNRRVVLYYFDREAGAYVSISGTARLISNPKEKARWWKDEWKAFYPDREKGFLLIAVTPNELEIVSEKKGIVGDSVRWTPPRVRFGSKRSR